MTSSTANATDVPLSAEGSERAQALRDALIAKNINNIYATNTIRAMATAKPLSEGTGVIVNTYALDSTFLKNLKILKGNTLVVGHSNTVDNIVNSFFVNPILKIFLILLTEICLLSGEKKPIYL
jgi:phosphohistidine phosphatase SixA